MLLEESAESVKLSSGCNNLFRISREARCRNCLGHLEDFTFFGRVQRRDGRAIGQAYDDLFKWIPFCKANLIYYVANMMDMLRFHAGVSDMVTVPT